MPLEDIIQQAITYLRGIWRYRWYTMAIAWVIAVAGWVVIIQLEDEYQASSKVSVNTDSLLRPLLTGLTIQGNVNQKILYMTRRLLTQSTLESLIRRTDLDLLVHDDASMNKMVRMLRKNIKISASKRTNIYTISASYSDPKIVKDIVEGLVTIFVEETKMASRTDSDSAQTFVETQIAKYETKLRAAENRKKEFVKKYAGRLPTSGGSYYQKLQAERTNYESALLVLKEAEYRRDELKSQMSGEEPVFGILPSTSQEELQYPHRLDARIKLMQTDLNNLMLQYTEQHPKIISLKEIIQDQTELRRKELVLLPKRRVSRPAVDSNPVYQQLKIEYSRAEAEVSALKVRTEGYKKRVDKIQILADTVPEIESRLNDLNRNYALDKKNYDTLIARLESAKLGQEAEKTGDDIKFEVIDFATVPTKPSGPKRVLLSTVAVVAGIVVGILVAFLLSQLRPAFYDQRTLRQVTGLPVFGSVSRIWTPQLLLKKRIEFGGFVSVGLVLCIAYVGVIVLGASAPELKKQVTETVRAISE